MIEINLLPEGQKQGAKRKAGRPKVPSVKGLSLGRDPWLTALLAVAVLVPLAALFLWLSQRAEARSLEERLEAATADSARLADLRAVSDSLSERQTLLRERMALIERLDRNRFVWPHLLDEISRGLPQFAWLTSVRRLTPLPDVSVQIQGMAANPLTITEFVRNLQASPYIEDVRILGSQQQELQDLAVQAFTLVAEFTSAAAGSTEPIVPAEGM
jgi:Tfp pilus assembly protein PilN